MATALFEYTFHVLKNIPKALELAAIAAQTSDGREWWWRLQVGKCKMHLKDYREAERVLKSSLQIQDMLSTRMHLAKVYLHLNQPKNAIKLYEETSKLYPYCPSPELAMARVYHDMNDSKKSFQPEVAELYYRRIHLVTGFDSAECWNNIGLCGFFAHKFDSALPCFERALQLSKNNSVTSEIWFNIGHVGINAGDLDLAHHAFKLSVSYSPSENAAAWNNLGIVEFLVSKNLALAESHCQTSLAICENAASFPDDGISNTVFEPAFNLAKMAMHRGNLETAYANARKSCRICPAHRESRELHEKLQRWFI
ncbi:Tetratricopeptide repeat protein 8 [Entophlyctis sp. JEL0112]|nr:Tetratricopeptide repeat protein 8 [Entophlyctis sp. JEL0112]